MSEAETRTKAFVLLAVAACSAAEGMNIDGFGPTCAAMFSC